MLGANDGAGDGLAGRLAGVRDGGVGCPLLRPSWAGFMDQLLAAVAAGCTGWACRSWRDPTTTPGCGTSAHSAMSRPPCASEARFIEAYTLFQGEDGEFAAELARRERATWWRCAPPTASTTPAAGARADGAAIMEVLAADWRLARGSPRPVGPGARAQTSSSGGRRRGCRGLPAALRRRRITSAVVGTRETSTMAEDDHREVVLDEGDVGEEVAGEGEEGHPADAADHVVGEEAGVAHPAHAGHERGEGAHDGKEAGDDDGRRAVPLEEGVGALEVLLLQEAGPLLAEELRPQVAALRCSSGRRRARRPR